jgi:hypothetical protein
VPVPRPIDERVSRDYVALANRRTIRP